MWPLPGAEVLQAKHLGATAIASPLESLCSAPRHEGSSYDVRFYPGIGQAPKEPAEDRHSTRRECGT